MAARPATSNADTDLFPCEPKSWYWLSRPLRFILGWIYLLAFSFSFMIVPLALIIFAMPATWSFLGLHGALMSLFFLFGLAMVPLREWVWARTWGELWFEIFQVSTNMSPAQIQSFCEGDTNGNHYVICMHPHGIVPFQGLLWAAFCNLYLKDGNGHSIYGFGAVADVVLMLPVLRSLMGFLACSGAGYAALYLGLAEGRCTAANAAGRRPKHLFILPGGIAEVFVSTPGEHKIVFRKRYGLVKLAIETGSSLIPCYVFGGTDFFHNLITADNLLAKWSRKLRVTFTIFYGRWGLPIPFTPRVTMVFADPLPVTKWNPQDGPIPKKLIEDLHEQYETAIKDVFDRYKVVAGYPGVELQIV